MADDAMTLSPNRNQTVMIIGNNNVFEVASYSEALHIGDNNILEAKARLGRQTELSNGCIIGAKCQVSGAVYLDGIITRDFEWGIPGYIFVTRVLCFRCKTNFSK